MKPQVVETSSAEPQVPEDLDSTRLSVLVVEPDPARKQVLNEIFRALAADIQVHYVATARQALGVSRTMSFACVALTEQLPDCESLGLISLLRDPMTLRQLPVVFLLNDRDDQATLDALHCGAHEVVAFNRLNEEVLLEKILSAVDRHQVATAISEDRLQAELNALELARRQQFLSEKLDELTYALRAPLGSINEFVSLALDGVGGEISDRNKKYLALARGACWTLERQISSLYEISDLSHEWNASHKSTVQMQDIFQLVMDELANESEFLDVRLVNATAADLPPVHADALQICQVLLQLVSRALSIGGPGNTVVLNATIPAREQSVLEISVLLQRCDAPTSDNVQTILVAPSHADRIAEQLEVQSCMDLLEVHRTQLEVRNEGATGVSVNFRLPIVEELLTNAE